MDSTIFIYALFVPLMVSLLTALFIGTDYSDGTMRNKLIAGHVRRKIYAANLINDILEQSIAGFYEVFINKRILPDIQMSEIRVMRQLDKEAVRRIFDNILSNAARYSDGDLAISLSTDGRIQFSNHAAKLSSVEVEKLFERFYTVETARNSTGIGLSIARLLTERMGGDITAEYKDGQLYIQIAF